jgi:GntR family transcriptional regulator
MSIDRLPRELPPDPSPLPIRIAVTIGEAIDAGAFVAGDRLPSEHELARRFGVSRQVARDGLQRLKNEGRIITQQGRGYFVNTPRIRRRLVGLNSYTETMRSLSHRSRTQVVRCRRVDTPAAFIGELGERSVLVHRTGWLDDEPVSSLRSWYPEVFATTLLDADLADRSITALLSAEQGVAPRAAHTTVSIAFADPPLAAELAVPVGAALFELVHLAWTTSRAPFEASRSYYRGDRFEFDTETAYELPDSCEARGTTS